MSETTSIGPATLKTLRGMIIDRDAAWRADPEVAPVIEAAIRKGLETIDSKTCDRIYMYLRYGPMDEHGQRRPLDGTYETYGYSEKRMTEAWRTYLQRYNMQPSET